MNYDDLCINVLAQRFNRCLINQSTIKKIVTIYLLDFKCPGDSPRCLDCICNAASGEYFASLFRQVCGNNYAGSC